MSLWPFQTRTLVLSCSADEAMRKLITTVKIVEKQKYDPKKLTHQEDDYEFNGWIGDHKFRISKRISHPDNFLPVVDGYIEATRNGSIMFVNFKLFFSSLMMLMFWTIISILLAVFFLFIYHQVIYAIIAIVVGLIQYLVVTLNFNRQVVRTWRTLKEVMV